MQRVAWILMSRAVLASAGCSTHPDPALFVEHYVELHRSGDVDRLLDLHAPDAEFLIPGQEPIRGAAGLRDLFEWDAVLRSELVMDGVSADGDTILIESVVERNRWFEGIGLSEARLRPGTKIVLRQGRIISTYLAAFDEQTEKRVVEQFQRLVLWLAANRQDTLGWLLPGGKFRYDAASARLWLEVLDEWNKSERPGA